MSTNGVRSHCRWALIGVVLVAIAGMGSGRDQRTLATLVASRAVTENVFRASVLPLGPEQPKPPDACVHMTFQHVFVLSEEGDVEWVGGERVLVGDGNGAFQGTDQNDLVINTGGRRTIHGEAGDDCLVAGPGGDQLHGGRGNDVLLGGEGKDKLHGHFGDNLLDGQEGRDVCAPGPGNDTLVECDIPHAVGPFDTSSNESDGVLEQHNETGSIDAEAAGSSSTLDPEVDGTPEQHIETDSINTEAEGSSPTLDPEADDTLEQQGRIVSGAEGSSSSLDPAAEGFDAGSGDGTAGDGPLDGLEPVAEEGTNP